MFREMYVKFYNSSEIVHGFPKAYGLSKCWYAG